jgi:hypothetical protein
MVLTCLMFLRLSQTQYRPQGPGPMVGVYHLPGIPWKEYSDFASQVAIRPTAIWQNRLKYDVSRQSWATYEMHPGTPSCAMTAGLCSPARRPGPWALTQSQEL